MSITTAGELVTMAHADGRAEASKEFLELARRMDGFLDHAADYGYINDSGVRLWNDVRSFIERASIVPAE